eukprot:1842219-Pleurochrysis_carterae.AAC.1
MTVPCSRTHACAHFGGPLPRVPQRRVRAVATRAGRCLSAGARADERGAPPLRRRRRRELHAD